MTFTSSRHWRRALRKRRFRALNWGVLVSSRAIGVKRAAPIEFEPPSMPSATLALGGDVTA